MDSGNSGSLQSSSGGDDDYDSRGGGGGGGVDSSPLSALLRPTPSPSAAGPFSLHGSLYGLQDFTSAPPQQQQHQQQAPWSSAQYMAGAASSSQRAAPADAGVGASAHQALDPSPAAAAPAPPRGSRKRARASRRAPTTVLTTDTSNFRAMVQEFTGIPNPPFAAGAGASFNTRFDHIFSSSSALRSAADPASSLPPYLLRPFAQKLQTAPAPSPFTPFTSPSSSTPPSSNIGGHNANVNSTTATTAATTANQRASAGDDYQLPSSSLLRMQQDQSSSYLSFQNLLGSTQPTSQHMFGGLSHGAPRLHEQSPSQLLSGGGIGLTHGGMMVSERMHLHQHQQRNDVHQGGDELSGLVRAGASGSSCKLNYTSSHAGASSSSAAASSDAPPDAGGASRPGRGEGIDPWLCTSE